MSIPPAFDPPACLLLGPGPSNAEPRVLRAMSRPLLGQFDPRFTQLMNEVMDLSRQVFQTANQQTYPVSGTSRAGLEAVLGSIMEEGDRVIVGVCGRFGWLFRDIARRYRAEVVEVEAEWGQIIPAEAVEQALRAGRVKAVAMVHGETSTGILQPLDDIARLCREHDTLLIVDSVVTLGGSRVAVDASGWDACIAGLQKCLGGPSGIAPITYNERVERAVQSRRMAPETNYLDLVQLERYWGPERHNHHTAPTSMVYALHEALRIVVEEGLDQRVERHTRVGRAMGAGLEALGLKPFGDRAHGLPFLNPVCVPEEIADEAAVRGELLHDWGIEIGAAFGPLQGKIWRIGTLGYNARLDNVRRLLVALEQVLPRHGFQVPLGQAVASAEAAAAERFAADPAIAR
ncbi:MAG: alanine--glyoxylate aminotransferase family protein [Chloroflexota bacterium]